VGGRVAGALPADAARITILRSDQLDGVQAAGKLLKSLPVVLVALSLALFVAALAVAPGWRRQAVRAYGAGLVAAGAGALVASSLTGDAVVERWPRRRRRNRRSGMCGTSPRRCSKRRRWRRSATGS
jgi:hypothetical protein